MGVQFCRNSSQIIRIGLCQCSVDMSFSLFNCLDVAKIDEEGGVTVETSANEITFLI